MKRFAAPVEARNVLLRSTAAPSRNCQGTARLQMAASCDLRDRRCALTDAAWLLYSVHLVVIWPAGLQPR